MAPERPTWRGRRVTVMGLGLFGGGAGTARHFASAGARVTVTDLRDAKTLRPSLVALADLTEDGPDGLRLVLGEHRAEDFTDADLVVSNPAVPPDNPWLSRARTSGVRVASDVELFVEACPAQLVAVTGTHGKTSTCTFLLQLLRHAGRRAHLGGNAGGSLWPELPRLGPDDVVVVLELSSYQLEALAHEGRLDDLARFEAVAVTNVTGDHLERHGTFERYADAKRAILALCTATGAAFVQAEGLCAAWPQVRGRRVGFGADSGVGAELRIEDGRFRLGATDLGAVDDAPAALGFQRENALVALGMAHALGVPPARLAAALPALRAPEHRMQDLGRRRGRRVFDNGVSTTPDSTAAALESLPAHDLPCALLCGGRLKDLPVEDLVAAARGRARRAICFGESAAVLAELLAGAGVDASVAAGLPAAVERAFEEGEGSEASILFSPACASYDAYPNFQARADEFRALLPPADD